MTSDDAGPAGARAVPLPAAVPAPAALVPHQHAGVHGGPRHLGGRGSAHRGWVCPDGRRPNHTRCAGLRAEHCHSIALELAVGMQAAHSAIYDHYRILASHAQAASLYLIKTLI